MRDFDEIYAKYFSFVYKFTLGLCKNKALAEEITQETFFKALKNIEKYDEKYRLTTWLCQIAKNTYFSYLRKNNKQADLDSERFISDENIESRFADKEDAAVIHKALHRLKDPYKEVFYLRVFGELSFAQIGVIFDKTENWARVTFYRAKIQIKEEME